MTTLKSTAVAVEQSSLVFKRHFYLYRIYKWIDMSRIDGQEYSVKILDNKIYWGFVVNWATFY